MSSIDELPPDQRAALSVLLRAGKSHEEVAQLLGIGPQAVHDRAHAALAVLAPPQARQLDASQREEIGEYLLGQQRDAGERLRTRTLLSSSPAAADWARALAAQIEPLAAGELPEIPSAGSAEAQAPETDAPAGYPLSEASAAPASDEPPKGEHARPSSRVGGALLLAAIVAAIIVVVVVVTNGGSSSHDKPTGTTASSGKPKAEGRITLHPPNPASHSTGTVQILSEGGRKAFFIQAEHIPANTGKDFYAIWLYNSPSSALALSKSPRVGANHKLAGAALLPNNASGYREILLTRETSTRPSRPGPIVLRGPLSL